ncbi:MAG: type 2 isopentenyl-diphosphate Delta-isomerase [Deltaproteobacteria bacterium 13_1_40CM_3_71_4]|nr:MAG: type 2 isopentenyl-diphosphate Delta-isomerase [Deltaproteobacteria bacterium 13_1_40CM_3_71_4]TMB52153.1 MAG: type 2 isopentenyl-diphosphate Delta-isomerase [Deltaproteobacteria bacterium]
MAETISDRKRSHLELCEAAEVEYAGKTTLLEDVDLVHNALPELAVDEIAVGTTLLGKPLRAPLLISGMTGGTEEATEINRGLARVAEAHGIGFGLGSQRAMHRTPALAHTFAVRDHAPTTLVLANLGLVQATALPSADVERLARAVGADAVCIHLNPAQEMIQANGDRDFRHGLATLARLVRDLPLPVIVKETGCGVSRGVGERLKHAGIGTVDVSGAGGTSWVKVETLRAGSRERELGEQFADWGIPTAATLLGLRGLGLDVIASGGIRTGLDVAKTIALGARAAGIALPVFRAYREGGVDAAAAYVERLVDGLRLAMVLTGSRDLEALGRTPVVLGGRLRHWLIGEGGA